MFIYNDKTDKTLKEIFELSWKLFLSFFSLGVMVGMFWASLKVPWTATLCFQKLCKEICFQNKALLGCIHLKDKPNQSLTFTDGYEEVPFISEKLQS